MKKINLTLTLITCLIICNKGLKAQGHNLEFEQAIHYTYSVAGDGNSTADILLTQTLIVPPNKILKIESANSTGSQANGAFLQNVILSLDNVILQGPRSLPSGTYTVKISDLPVPGITQVNGYISGILYNIVP